MEKISFCLSSYWFFLVELLQRRLAQTVRRLRRPNIYSGLTPLVTNRGFRAIACNVTGLGQRCLLMARPD